MLSRLLSVPPLLTVAERPAAVLFLPDVMHRAGAGAGASDVMESSGLGQRLRSKGFTTCVLSDWGAYSGVDAFAKHVAAQVRRDLHIPPVVIAHGFGGYLAQKYLESFPAAAVVFVGAVGPRPAEVVDCSRGSPDAVTAYMNRCVRQCGVVWCDNATAVLRDAAREPVELERNVVPMVAVASHHDAIVPVSQQAAIAHFHGLADDDVITVNTPGSHGSHFMVADEWHAIVDDIVRAVDELG